MRNTLVRGIVAVAALAAACATSSSQEADPAVGSDAIDAAGDVEPQEVVVAAQARKAEVQPAVAPTTFSDNSLRLRSAPGAPVLHPDWNTESYDLIQENAFLAVVNNPLSTFSIDVDRASYGNIRRFLRDGVRPPKDAVRIEEMINYFPYDYPEPEADAPFSITTDVAAAPWRPQHRLVRIGLRTASVDTEDLPPSNLVFLLDVSGSMRAPNKLPLVKRSLRLLVNELREDDRVAIVVYAGAAGLVLPSTPGSEKAAILEAIDRLEAGGSTAGGAGIRLAYDIARKNFVRGGNNRVILATDGDFNVGVSSDAEMVRLVEEERRDGVFLTVLGFGTGNLKDSKMEKLADHGNGNYAYIDGLLEARKVLVHEMGGTLLTVAKDVKIQVEFNPARVQAYRLIGYENRLLAAEDFNDDTKDAGEIGAGHTVTALYEIVPAGIEPEVEIRGVDPLRYGARPEPAAAAHGDELAYVKIRYKAPDGERSRLLERPIVDRGEAPSEDFNFAAAVAAFGMLLRDSEYVGRFEPEAVVEMASAARGEDPHGYRAEFVRLVQRFMEITRGEVVAGRGR
ncbi:MAG TPA: VWA domain-containing protein [Longimicrobiales bacterium]